MVLLKGNKNLKISLSCSWKEELSSLCYGLINIENGWIQEPLWREVQCLFKDTGVYGLEIQVRLYKVRGVWKPPQ